MRYPLSAVFFLSTLFQPFARLSSSCAAEEPFLVVGSVDAQAVSFVAAFVKAHASLRVSRQLIFRGFKLQVVNVELLVHRSCVEQELMRRDSEQRLCQLSDSLEIEVLEVLRGKDDRRVLFSYTLHKVTDILHRNGICEEQIELVNAGNCVSCCEQIV